MHSYLKSRSSAKLFVNVASLLLSIIIVFFYIDLVVAAKL